MSAKGRVKYPNKQMPSLLGQMFIRIFDEQKRKSLQSRLRKTKGFLGLCPRLAVTSIHIMIVP